MADRLYVSNKNETVRMFESDFMEFFSRVHPVIPLALYLPVVGYMLYLSVWQRHLSFIAVAALFLLGVLLWTLIEYLIHRYIFHYEPKTRWGKQLHFVIHGVHHDYPNDARRLVMPPVIPSREDGVGPRLRWQPHTSICVLYQLAGGPSLRMTPQKGAQFRSTKVLS